MIRRRRTPKKPTLRECRNALSWIRGVFPDYDPKFRKHLPRIARIDRLLGRLADAA